MRILVCGSNCGRACLDAIDAQSLDYTLSGLLARGNERPVAVPSLRLAADGRARL